VEFLESSHLDVSWQQVSTLESFPSNDCSSLPIKNLPPSNGCRSVVCFMAAA
jgi:hypothetical protein